MPDKDAFSEFLSAKDTNDEHVVGQDIADSPSTTEPSKSSSFYSDGEGISRKLVSLVIGIVVILLIPLGLFTLSKGKSPSSPSKKQSQSSPLKGMLTPTQAAASDWKIYSDSTSGYSVRIPKNWETFKRAGDETSYQIGIHPLNSEDVPVTIGSQPAQGKDVVMFIDSEFGAGAPREKKQINNKEALYVTAGDYNSYFLTNGSRVIEISVATGKEDYLPVFNRILSTFNFQ